MRRSALAWFALPLAVSACGAERCAPGTRLAARSLPASGVEIRYVVDAARPRTDFALTIPPAGDAELALWVPLGDAPGPLGRFRAPIAAETRRAIERHVRDEHLIEAVPGERSTAEGSGSISLATPEGRTDLGLARPERAVGELRSMLDPILAEVARHPVAAVEASVRGEPSAQGLSPVLELSHVGSEPLDLVLVDGDLVASVVIRVTDRDGHTRQAVLGGKEMQALVGAGKIRSGITVLGPGEHIAFPLGTTVEPGTRVNARLSCWYPGPGKARGSLMLDAEAELR